MNTKLMAALAVLLLTAQFSYAGGSSEKETGGLSLQDAIEQSAEKIAGEFPPGTRVAIVAFEADSQKLSDFIRTELAAALINRGIEVVARHSIEYINREIDFQMSGQVSDETALSVGKYVAAEFLIIGQLQNLGDTYRLTTTITRVEQATHAGIPRFDVRNDRALKNMIAALDKQSAAAALPAVSADKTPQTAGTFLDRGIMFAMRGDYETAIADFTEAIRLNPDMAGAYILRARALFASVSKVAGVGENFSGLTTFSTGGQISAEQAQIYDRAIADLTQAIRLDPNNARAYNGRGVAYSDKGDYDRALADFTQVIRINPNDASAYHSRALAYSYKDDYDRAIADFTQSIRINPNYAEAYFNRGFEYYNKGDYDRAIADFTQVIRLDPDVTAYTMRGLAYSYKDDYDRAIADLTQVIRINPNDADIYVSRGLYYSLKGDIDRAIADLETALRINPNHANARKDLEAVRQQRGR